MKWSSYLVLLAVFVLACGEPRTQEKQSALQRPDARAQAQAFIEKGMEDLRNQDIVGAIQSFDNAIKTEPQNPENFLVLGQVYLRLRNYDKAVDTLNAGTRVDPNNGEIYYFLGAAHAIRQHTPGNAQEDFDRQEAVGAAKRSVEIFIQERNEEKLKLALGLLKSLEEGEAIGEISGQ
ncbi:MAG TPA: tetratricopeptide repeat protein [Candidatus Omnitrophota bacterium]|nr:tetratricopeptide repeat protein [Candidatus Omnitrophota bacterium]